MFRVSEPASSSIDKDARIAELEAALAARDTLIDTLRHQLAQLRRMTFGQSSEKLALQIEQLELALEELEGEAEVADSRTTERAPAERPSPVRALPDHLPRAERADRARGRQLHLSRLRRRAAPAWRRQRRATRHCSGSVARHPHRAAQV